MSWRTKTIYKYKTKKQNKSLLQIFFIFNQCIVNSTRYFCGVVVLVLLFFLLFFSFLSGNFFSCPRLIFSRRPNKSSSVPSASSIKSEKIFTKSNVRFGATWPSTPPFMAQTHLVCEISEIFFKKKMWNLLHAGGGFCCRGQITCKTHTMLILMYVAVSPCVIFNAAAASVLIRNLQITQHTKKTNLTNKKRTYLVWFFHNCS